MRVCELLLLIATELDEGETVEWRCGAELTKCEVVERRCDYDEEALVDGRGVALVAVGTLGAARRAVWMMRSLPLQRQGDAVGGRIGGEYDRRTWLS
jgi:hypothetical protein